MNRETEAELLSFCLAQKGNFNEGAWAHVSCVPKTELGVVAFFLAVVKWYATEENSKLRKIAENLNPGVTIKFPAMMKEINFDGSRFLNMLNQRLDYAKKS